MFKFPKDLYCDVRIEKFFQTAIRYELDKYEEIKEKTDSGAFIRVFDGIRWYFSSTTEVANLQEEIDNLAKLATPNPQILSHPIVAKFEVNKEECIKFDSISFEKINIQEKLDTIQQYAKIIKTKNELSHWRINYTDKNTLKEFYSSKGASLKFDTQIGGLSFGFTFGTSKDVFSDGCQVCEDNFPALKNHSEKLQKDLDASEEFFHKAETIDGGNYTVVLSPMATGIFAHESFGHKSEADFAIGDETMMKEWCIGKRVGSDVLTITDTGENSGSGYIPFDDEGTRIRKTYLIKEGILQGRLHNAESAACFSEELTGNARAVNFEFEPIVRMTSTCVAGGEVSKEELISEIDKGILIETINHGSGMSTFTLAPSRAYLIEGGKVTKPVKFSVITGNVMSTLNEIDKVSKEYKVISSASGGCGKMEQYPLPVSFGGPYIRIKKINVQ